MSTKWKYATLPAETRLDMVKSGNKDVYENEIARSVDVINSRKALGLDITDQKNWIDSIGYNYNLYNAGRMGIDEKYVNEKGYADRILGEFDGTTSKKPRLKHSNTGNNVYLAKKYLEEFYERVGEAAAKRSYVKEWLANNGIAEESDTGKQYLDDFDKELEALTDKYRKEYVSKVNAL